MAGRMAIGIRRLGAQVADQTNAILASSGLVLVTIEVAKVSRATSWGAGRERGFRRAGQSRDLGVPVPTELVFRTEHPTHNFPRSELALMKVSAEGFYLVSAECQAEKLIAFFFPRWRPG